MRRRLAFALLSIALLPCSAAAAEQGRGTIAIFSIDDDPVRAAALQAALEASLADLADHPLTPSATIAAAAGVKQPAQKPPEIPDLIGAARRAAAEDRLVDALEALDSLERLQDGWPATPPDDRAQLHLRRASVLEATGANGRCDDELRAALAIRPALKADTSVFRPSLVERLDALRSEIGDATITLVGLPKGATALVDGAAVAGAKVKVATGRHRIHLTGDGFRAVDLDLDVAGDRDVAASLPVALDAGNRAMLARAMDGGAADGEAFDLLLFQAGGSSVAVVASGNRARLWRSGEDPSPPSPAMDDPAALADWVAARLVQGLPKTPRGAGRPHGIAKLLPGTAAEASLVLAQRRVAIGSGPQGATGRFRGEGLRLLAEWRHGPWIAHATGAIVSYGTFPAPVRHAGADVKLSGGVEQSAALFAGRRFWLDGVATHVVAITPSVGVDWERLDAKDLRDATGALGLLPSHTLVTPEARADVRLPLLVYGQRGIFDAGVGVTPFGRFREWPRGATGGSPSVEPAWRSTAALTWTPGPWSATVAWDEARERISFRGVGGARVAPALSGAHLIERYDAVLLTAHRSF